jgi:hypothetical protein
MLSWTSVPQSRFLQLMYCTVALVLGHEL